MTRDRKISKEEAIRNGIDSATEAAQDKARHATDRITDQAEDRIKNAADAASAAAAEFDRGSLQQQASEQVAAQLTDVAQRLSRTDLDKAAGQVTRFARENPMLFLGGAAILGFAAARFLKASNPQSVSDATASLDDPWTGYVTSSDPAPTAHTMPARDTQPGGYTNGRAGA